MPRLGLAGGRVTVPHLGPGASPCAMRDGRSLASTMAALEALIQDDPACWA